MAKNRTVAAPGAVAMCCWLAACTQADFTPQTTAAAAAALRDPTPRAQLLPAVVALTAGRETALPAPAFESQIETPPVRTVPFLLGQGAATCFDAELQAACASAQGGLQFAATGCPDRDAIESMMQGRAGFAVIAGRLSERDLATGLRQTRLGIELFAVAVASHSPLRSLSRQQIRKVFTGEIRTWTELGQNGGDIAAFAPRDTALAARASRALIPGDPFGAHCSTLTEAAMPTALHNGNAIGVVRLTGVGVPEGIRVLQIDWGPATAESFELGTYPFGNAITLVTSGQPASAAAGVLAFARSEEGRAMLGARLLLPR